MPRCVKGCKGKGRGVSNGEVLLGIKRTKF